MSNYYVVTGRNAVAVVASWNHAMRIQKYFKGFFCKGYDTYDEANEAGLDHLSKIIPYYVQLPECLTLGKVVTSNALHTAYLEGLCTK